MKKLWKVCKPYRLLTIGVVLLTMLQMLGSLFIPTMIADIVNNGIITGDMQFIQDMGKVMLLVAAGTGVVGILATYTSSVLASGIGRDVRNQMFAHIQSFSIHDFNQIGTASMITRSTSDVNQIQQAIILFMQMFLPAPMIAMGGLYLAYHKDRQMALIIGVTIVIVTILTFLIGRRAVPLFKRLQSELDQMNRKLRETITGVRVIRAFDKVEEEEQKVNKAFDTYAQTSIRVNKIFALLMPFVMTTVNLATLAIVWFGGKRVAGGFMEIGNIMAFIEYTVLILYYLIMGILIFMMISRAQVCAMRIEEVLCIKPEIKDGVFHMPVEKTAKGHKIEFKEVSFGYAGAEETVLNGISFYSDIGETTAIIGGTGSGKSTIASLIPRFFDIQGGEICIDGVNIKQMPQEMLRKKIGFVPQKAFLFSGTIAENLRFGDKDANEEVLQQALQTAQATEFVQTLAGGLEARVSQGGSNFSGGQKQRLSIARALVKKPEIYIFDDSFSALDFKTDAKLREALKTETAQSTVILVAQRISTIMNADRILVIEEGKVAGMGTHKELMAQCEVYRQIAYSQLSKEELM